MLVRLPYGYGQENNLVIVPVTRIDNIGYKYVQINYGCTNGWNVEYGEWKNKKNPKSYNALRVSVRYWWTRIDWMGYSEHWRKGRSSSLEGKASLEDHLRRPGLSSPETDGSGG